jgi:siroheme synthase (precorrin-2 oxidase/ferrochelatase)
MRKDAEEQKKLYCKQMKEMALEDRLFLKIDSSIIKDESNDMELGKKIRAMWNKKDKQIEDRLKWLESRMNDNE